MELTLRELDPEELTDLVIPDLQKEGRCRSPSMLLPGNGLRRLLYRFSPGSAPWENSFPPAATSS